MTNVSYCVVCGEPKLKRAGALYCSEACRQKAKYDRNLKRIADTDEKQKARIRALEKINELYTNRLHRSGLTVEDMRRRIHGLELLIKYKPNNIEFQDTLNDIKELISLMESLKIDNTLELDRM
jgi:uncharacterized Zn finger protein (UPF0148 family)